MNARVPVGFRRDVPERSLIMRSRGIQQGWTRRRLLAAGCTTVGTLAFGAIARAGGSSSGEQDEPYHPFQMGLQSYSLRGYTRDRRPDLQKALAVTKELGLHFWESYTAHVPMTADAAGLSACRRELAAAGVTVVGYGVVPLTQDAAANRRIFE